MPWFVKYDGVDGSSHSDGAHLLYDLVVPAGQKPDEAVTFTAIALAKSRGQQTGSGYGNPSSFQIISQGGAEGSSRLFVGNLTYDSHEPTSTEPRQFCRSNAPHFRFLPVAN